MRPIRYALSPPFSALADLAHELPEEYHQDWQQSLARAVDAVAGLTAVDGATVLTDRYEVLAFGAKIARRDGCFVFHGRDDRDGRLIFDGRGDGHGRFVLDRRLDRDRRRADDRDGRLHG